MLPVATEPPIVVRMLERIERKVLSPNSGFWALPSAPAYVLISDEVDHFVVGIDEVLGLLGGLLGIRCDRDGDVLCEILRVQRDGHSWDHIGKRVAGARDRNAIHCQARVGTGGHHIAVDTVDEAFEIGSARPRIVDQRKRAGNTYNRTAQHQGVAARACCAGVDDIRGHRVTRSIDRVGDILQRAARADLDRHRVAVQEDRAAAGDHGCVFVSEANAAAHLRSGERVDEDVVRARRRSVASGGIEDRSVARRCLHAQEITGARERSCGRLQLVEQATEVGEQGFPLGQRGLLLRHCSDGSLFDSHQCGDNGLGIEA